ncbi:MAG TPA: NAD(P)H-dependent oxidoreductase subunit E [Solirubrobacterales bacterium]|jgi:NADH:ubiquinone oxidoreductase subunit E
MSNHERQGDETPAIDPALEQGPQTSEHGTSGPLRPTDELSAAERQALIASMSPEDAERVPELHEVEVPPELREQIEEAMGRYPQLRSASIPALWAVQRHYGWCSPEGIRQAAAVMGVSPAYLQSVASFYDLFRLTPTGRNRILVCHNISCWMRGADDLLKRFCEATGADHHEAEHNGANSPDGEFFVQGFECLGACDIAPMASINQHYYGPIELDEVETVIDRLRRGEDPLPEKDIRKRTLAGGADAPEVETNADA